MKTGRQLSRMFFKPVNGKATPAQPQRTRDGWPMGRRKSPAGTWITFIEPLAYAKLMTWYRESKGLELSGYALLAEPVSASDPRCQSRFPGVGRPW